MVIHSLTLELELNTETAKALREIAEEVGAFLHSDRPIYPLASGKRSTHYFEGKRITLSPKGAYLVGKAVFDEVSGIGVDAVGGLVIGAALIVSVVASISYQEGKPIPTFIVREEPKAHGTKKQIEGHLKPGSRVAIVDDVITTGTSVFKAIKAVEAANCKVVKVIALVDRHEGGSDELRRQGYDFTAFLAFKAPGEVTIDEPSAVTGQIERGAIPR